MKYKSMLAPAPSLSLSPPLLAMPRKVFAQAGRLNIAFPLRGAVKPPATYRAHPLSIG